APIDVPGSDAGRDSGPGDGGPGDAGCTLGPPGPQVCEAQRRPALCGAACVDLTHDADHCGRCGRACADGEVCIHAGCVDCEGILGTTICDGRCTRPEVDPLICAGGCGGAGCAADQQCGGGTCMDGAPGSRCANPLVLGSMPQTVTLWAAPLFEVPRPFCATDAPIVRAAVVDFTPAASGTPTFEVLGDPGERVAVWALVDGSCECAARGPTFCDTGVRVARLSNRVEAGTRYRVVVASGSAGADTLRVRVTP
ncbi:MAG TPA: hypothetical protein RMH99_13545, partial [Sandaracinaceae bacterium LLY-WYZ-13_1]|nr:hypothetical protein [Sandaracinaceae bacterium LLY-WYZ-13_1]